MLEYFTFDLIGRSYGSSAFSSLQRPAVTGYFGQAWAKRAKEYRKYQGPGSPRLAQRNLDRLYFQSYKQTNYSPPKKHDLKYRLYAYPLLIMGLKFYFQMSQLSRSRPIYPAQATYEMTPFSSKVNMVHIL